MADGDIVHSKLAKVFHNAYRGICSDGFEAEDEAHELATPLKQTLQSYGDTPIQFLTALCQVCADGIPDNPGQIIESLARQYYGDQSGIEVARMAGSRYIDNCRYEGVPMEPSALYEAYVLQTYVSEFKDKIPLNVEHYNHLHADEFSDRLTAVESFIDKEAQAFAKQIMRDSSVVNLRRRPYKGQSIGLYEEAY